MSDSETPRSLRDELEVRVIALLTGELSEADADELEKILSADEALSDFRDRMASLMGEVHSAREEIAPPAAQPPMRLSEERRREIFGDVVPEEAAPKEDARKWWHLGFLEIAAMLIVAGVLAAIMIPSLGAVRSSSEEARARADAHASDMEKQIAMAELNAPAEEFKMESQTDYRSESLAARNQSMSVPVPMSRQRALPEVTKIRELASSGDFGSSDAFGQAEREGSADYAPGQGAFNGYAESAPVDAFASMPRQSPPTRSGLVDPFAAPPAAAASKPSSVNGPVASSGRPTTSYGDAESANGKELSKLVARNESMRWNAGYDDMDGSEADDVATRSDILAIVDQAWERPKVFERRGRIAADSMSASSLRNKLDDIIIPQVRFREMPLVRVIETLSELSVEYDYERMGVNILPLVKPDFDPKITLSLEGATLRDILTEVSELSGTKFIETREAAVLRNLDSEWIDLGGRGGKMQTILLPHIQFNGMLLSEAVDVLQKLSKEYDPEREGVLLDYKPIRGEDPRVNIALRNLSLDRVLQFVTQQVGYEFVSVDDGALIQPRGQSAAEQIAAERLKNTRQTPKAEKSTQEAPVSTFSLNVSDVSFKLAQAALSTQRIPAAELIRTEEFVNSFDYGDPAPRENEPVTLNWEIAQHPFAHNRQIVRFSLQTQAAGRAANQPLNLNLLIDNSGSMQRPDRRAILEKSLESLHAKLTDQDQLNIVLFARQPKLIASASNLREHKVAIERALDYQPQGGTNLESGLQVAYEVAAKNYDPAASNRVILMTDGAANLGDVDSSSLARDGGRATQAGHRAGCLRHRLGRL